jgi:hypothetical protein
MKKHSPLLTGLVVMMSLAVVIPPEIAAQAQAAQPGQRAGEVSRVIPQVRIVRGTQQITGAANYPVDWGDLVNTQRSGRARIALDDGSVMNVGSESSLKITQYNPGAQQTEMDLAYGRLRSKVAKITQPNGKFEVHTPVGVAGVVGTDFALFHDVTTNVTQLIVFEGAVRFCNLAGVCIVVGGGMMSTIRGNNQAPDAAMPAPPSMLAEAGAGTETVGAPVVAAAGISTLAKIGLIALVGIPAVVIPIAVTHNAGNGAPAAPCVVGKVGAICSQQGQGTAP